MVQHIFIKSLLKLHSLSTLHTFQPIMWQQRNYFTGQGFQFSGLLHNFFKTYLKLQKQNNNTIFATKTTFFNSFIYTFSVYLGV